MVEKKNNPRQRKGDPPPGGGGGGGGTPLTNPTPIISAGDSHTLAIVDGKLYAWGNFPLPGGPNVLAYSTHFWVNNNTNFVAVSVGFNHSLAVDETGNLWVHGANDYGQLGNNSYNGVHDTYFTRNYNMGSVDIIEAGYSHSFAIKSNGELYAWGYNWSGQLGLGNTIDRTSPVRVGTASNWLTVSAGSDHTLAINSAGELYAWGGNGSGQLGDGTTTYKTSPVRIGTETNWVSISAGANHSLAINDLGELYAWGYNWRGQLGLGDSGSGTHRNVPTRVGEETNWSTVTGGESHSLAINSVGELYAWGENGSGQLGLGDTTNRNVPTRVGDANNWETVTAGVTSGSSFAQNDQDEIYCWGGCYMY